MSRNDLPNYAAVIGDVIKSRQHRDRFALQRALQEALSEVNDEVPPVQPLKITIGDEFQGLYPSLELALLATLYVSLRLIANEAEVRFGVGWGVIPIQDAANVPFGQDGPAWWKAREALDRISESEKQQRWPRTWRTAVNTDGGVLDGMTNAFLLCRDDLIGRLDQKDIAIAIGIFRGEQQDRLADRLSMSQSAVAQRLQNHGIYALLRAHEQLA